MKAVAAGLVCLILLAGCTHPELGPGKVSEAPGAGGNGAGSPGVAATGVAATGTSTALGATTTPLAPGQAESIDGVAWPGARGVLLNALGISPDVVHQLPGPKPWTLVALAQNSIVDDVQHPTQVIRDLVIVAVPGPLADTPQGVHAVGHWYSVATLKPSVEATRFFVADSYSTSDLLHRMDVQGLQRQPPPPAGGPPMLVQVRGALAGVSLPTQQAGISVAAVTLLNASADAGGEIGIYSVPGILLDLGTSVDLLGGQAFVTGVYIPLDASREATLNRIASDTGGSQLHAAPREASLPDVPAVDVNELLQKTGANVAVHRVPGFILAVQATPATGSPRTLQSMMQTPPDLVVPISTEAYVTGSTVQTACIAAGGTCSTLPYDIGIYDALNVTLQGPAFYHMPIIVPTSGMGKTFAGVPMYLEGIWITKSLLRDAAYARLNAWALNHNQTGTARAFLTGTPPWLHAIDGFLYVTKMIGPTPIHAVPFPIIQLPIQRAGSDAQLEWTPACSPDFLRYEVHRTTGLANALATMTDCQATTFLLHNYAQYGVAFKIWVIDRTGTPFTSESQPVPP